MNSRKFYIVNAESVTEKRSRVCRGPVTTEYLENNFPWGMIVTSVQEIDATTYRALFAYYVRKGDR